MTRNEIMQTTGVKMNDVEFLGALTRVETRLADGEMIRIAVLDHPVDNLAIGTTLTLAYDPRRVTELKTS